MPKTVLIVEDEYLIATDIQRLLESRGWRVMGPVPSVRAALRLLEGELPSVAVLDVNLGTELVTPVAEALTARHVPFVLATAHDRPERIGGQVLAGVPNLGKPVSEQELLATLARMTGA
ncbi:response regulator [Roseomonas sp. CCTCC AB2023176]|uniref:response regulator n=1 Tax=Roseomonas sp. CCTCC AB2023176 TaxID=3342640 RepID=UPI0035D82070